MFILKKILISLSLLTILFGGLISLTNVQTNAQQATNANQIIIEPKVICNNADGSCPVVGKSFGIGNKNVLSSFILQIARFITYIAGAIAVIVIVISGVQRMNSTNADAAKNSNTSITNAAIGLAVAILAYTIVGVLSVFLVGSFFG